MARKSQTVTKNKRQPAAHRLSLPGALASFINKSGEKTDRSKKSRRKKRQFKVLLTHSTQIVITIKPVRSASKKKKVQRMSVWPYLPLNRQTAISIAMVLVGILGSMYFGWHSVFASSPSTVPSITTKGLVPPAAGNDVKRTRYPKSLPTHLTIPAIGVDTTVSTVGKNPDGSITVPSDFHTAGWYQYSPTPGEVGPSIIVGHLDNVSGIAVFWRLHELVPGNIIQVARADGRTLQFRVDSVKQFSQNAFPDKEVYGNIDYAGLRLITCGGTFNRLTHHYDQNTVVYASLE